MDWASSQWKEGLSSIALQKISALEEKIEKLQKERKQKQHQFDCLELTLNKEKRKVEEEKQQTVRLERELQSLSDACKSFESKQQKFLADIQNRDSRINNLESQLSQAKKQNCRLQQLENDIEELRCLKESAKLETRQLEEKLIKEQDTIVKQSDAISGLEKTVRSLQEKCSNSENSVLLNVTDKENINILNISNKDNIASESLRKKVLEHENTIKNLQEELTRLSGSKEKLSTSINDSFATPAKGKNTSRDTSVSLSYWDSFGSTPAKSGKLTKHINDSSSFNNESDEKVHSLQLKLKQMCQELECQRHNFEATKNVMEQRFKEKENSLKSEVKQQAQTIFDLDKELKEFRTKYQQDVVQGSKKLDVVNMQLQKSELSKQQMEKDLKALEVQMNSKNNSLLQKEEELKDILKLKNSLEASTKSLQSEKRELEKNYSSLMSQKNSLSEDIKDLKIQLDGSSNLVKEKESLISNMKKEQSSSLKIKSDLENKINALNKNLSSLQSEKSVFEKQLQELNAEISVIANNLESVKEEKKNISSVLDLEKSKSEKLKCDLDKKEKELMSLQSETKSNEMNIMSLKTELEQLTGDCNVKIKDMEQKLCRKDEEISHLKNEVQTYLDNKKAIEENVTELKNENVRISELFASKESECECFRKQIENLESDLQSAQSDNATKHENICVLEEKIKSIDEDYYKQLTELKDSVCILKSEKADLETLLKDCKIDEESLKATVAKAQAKMQELSELLAAEKEKNKELDAEFQNLQMELNSKDMELAEFKDAISLLKSEKADLETLLNDYKINEESLKATIVETEAEKHNLSELLTAEEKKSKELDSQLSDLKATLQNLQTEVNSKDMELTEFRDAISLLKSEKTDLETLLNDYKINEESLKATIVETETEKHNLSELLTAEEKKSKELDSQLSDLKATLQNLQTEVNSKDEEFTELKNTICLLKSEKSDLETLLKDYTINEETLKATIAKTETEKHNLSEFLTAEEKKSKELDNQLSDLKETLQNLQTEMDSKDKEFTDLKDTLCLLKSEKADLETLLKDYNINEESLKAAIVKTETEKHNLSELLTAEEKKNRELDAHLSDLKTTLENLQMEVKNKEAYINDMNETLCAIKSEKSALENNFENLAVKEKTLENNLIQVETDKQNLLDLFNKEKIKSEALQSSLVEFEKIISDQQGEITVRDLSIRDLNKHIEELKKNICGMNENFCAIKLEKSALENDLKNLSVKEKTLENNLIQAETDNQNLLDLLNKEKDISETLEFSEIELKMKLRDQQEEITAKDFLIKDLNKHIGKLKEKMSEMNESVLSIKSETVLLQKNLKACAANEETLIKKLSQSKKEKQEISELLSEEEEKCRLYQLSVSDLEKTLNNLKTELDAKDSIIGDLNKNIDELKAKTCEISENIDVIKSENISLQKNLESCLKTEEELKNSLKQAEAEKQNMVGLLSTEQKQTEKFQLEITELKNQVNDMEDKFKEKDLIILDLTESIENQKAKLSDMEETISTVNSEKACLENNLKDCTLREKSFENDLQVFETDKQKLSEQLTAEKEKSEELHLLVSELTKKVDSQQADLSLKETTIDDRNQNIEELKIKVCNLTEDIASLKSERLIVENELNDMTLKVELLQKNLLQMENEKDKINEHLTAEKSKNETLELNLAETKLKLDSFHDELDSKNMNMELMNKKLEELKYHEDHLEDLESQLVMFREKEISLNEKINQLEEEKTVTFESLSTEKNKNLVLEANISEFQVKVENLESQLKATNENFSSITSDIAQSKDTYELKLKEFETALEVMKSKNDNMSNQIKDFIETETALKKTMKMIEAEKENMSENLLYEIKKAKDLQMNIEELKDNLSTRKFEIYDKDKIICDLKKEIEDLRRTYEEEKDNLVIHIGDIKYSLLSMQDSVKNIYSENNHIQSDMSNLKQECQELLRQKACAQQSREEFLFGLLNQLGVIEKHVEALEENYEGTISDLRTQLWNAELKSALQCEDYDILMNENTELKQQLKSVEERSLESEKALKNVAFIENELVNCRKIIEDSKSTHEHASQKLQDQISNLKADLSKVEEKIVHQNEECSTHLEEKSNLLNELKMAQEQLRDKETALEKAILNELEHLNCPKIIENLTNNNKVLTENNDQLQEQICDLNKVLSEADSTTTIQEEKLDTLSEEKFSLMEELKAIKEILCSKERDCDNLTAIKINLCEENANLLTELSSVSQDLHLAKERLNFLDSKLKVILLKCKDALSCIKNHGEQKEEIFLDLMNTMSSYELTENKIVSQEQQMENMCNLVCQCLEVLEEQILIQSTKLEIPIQVVEIGNQYFQAKEVKTNNWIIYHDENVEQLQTDCQNLQTSIAKDLIVLSTDVYTLLCSLEERVLNQKNKFKFLMHHQLIECTNFKKMLLTLKFMKTVYSKVCCRKLALQELKNMKMYLLSQNKLPQNMASILNSFSSNFKENNDVNLFFEKFLVVNAYKNIYMAHRLKKAFYFVKDQLNMHSEKFEKHERYFSIYQNIHIHPSHMPILTQSKYKTYLNGLPSLCYQEKLKGDIRCLTKNKEQLFSINSRLCNVKASTVPLILNCMVEFYENNSSYSVYKNLVYLIMKLLQSCCLKEVSLLSSHTIKTVEDFLVLLPTGNLSVFKNILLRNQMNTLRDLVSSLLRDLSSIKHLVFSGEQELQMNKNVLNEVLDQLNKVKFDHECKQKELDLLQALLQEERDKQQNLPMLTKNECNALLSEKEKLEKTVLEISKLCSVLKNIFSENCDVLNLQAEIATLSDTFCLCQTCLNTLESREKPCDHKLFSPVTLIHLIAELFNSKSDLEKEVVKLEECKSIIKHDIMQLESDKSLLQHTMDDLEGNVNTLEHELNNFKSKYSVLETEYQNINSLYIESNKIKEDQENCMKTNMEEIRNCKRQYEELLADYQKVKNDLGEKEEEISNYKKSIKDKISQYEILDLKCKSYESEIGNLNSAITKLTDLKQKESEDINNSLIKEMTNKITSLEKSNNLLNMTVETVEEELQTVYEEKQNIQKELQVKLDEVMNLQQEIASWKNKMAEENSEVSCLEQTVQKLTTELKDTETKCTELLNKNSTLQSDVALLEQNIKDYEKCIIEKDRSIEENNNIVEQLREEILVITNEKKNLQINIEETEANLKLELQKKDTLLHDFKKNLNHILKEKADLEKQISCLLISEEERKELLLEKETSELKCKKLIEEIDLLRSKLENFELQATSNKKEKEKAFQTIKDLTFEKEECITKLEKLKDELNIVKKSNVESSILIEELQKKLDSVKECNSTQLAKGSTLSDSLQVHSLTECKCEGNCSVSELAVTKSEHDYRQYMTKIINVFIIVIKGIECSDDNHKTDLISMLSKWESNIQNPTHLSEIKAKLGLVLDIQFRKLQQLELELCNLKDLICKLTSDLNHYCKITEQQKIKYNVNMLSNKSCFEESMCVSPAKHQTYFVLNSYVGDMKSSLEMLELGFKSMKDIITNKDREIKSLKERCPDKGKDEVMQSEQKNEYLILKNKCKLLISNGHRLEKDYKKLLQTNEELENRIKILEQEKVELNAEADEMAEIIKQQNYSGEMENLYKKVYESADELHKLKEKNKCLRAILEQYEDVFRKHGINIPAAQNLVQH